jgi:hypothetical protein
MLPVVTGRGWAPGLLHALLHKPEAGCSQGQPQTPICVATFQA